LRILAHADHVEIGVTVDLAAAQKEDVDAPLADAVVKLASALGERVADIVSKDQRAGLSTRHRLREQRCGGR
jgi:hypothetical protein